MIKFFKDMYGYNVISKKGFFSKEREKSKIIL